ncbi:hypothetical protein ACQKCJ_19060 [Flavobacterium sp. NPDC079362]|uniref:hypothetical protein n=1 Tax=Flavobacterium sp. NPDC079362 TaxID=3390566 RepID=UPI003D0441EE
MEDLIKQFEKDLRQHLENVYSASVEPDDIKRLDQAEKTVFDFVDDYLLESALIARDVERPTQEVLDQFARSKINYIE